ncbi:RcnB family protein [Acinetobacter gerneri]|uniref:RcnB family protein n=1 Tax=Acinetobacter gerneri TaxID=202952 RepID=A0AAW8JJD8_9GAMM|nr:RcnB family protein [Acinetobacter gerneri]MDQ9010670.1 RcnB family protein [Acinetobacter gerneri]MDQ9014898.1 RcnB family protein [Acinetobacter gerneri]MDQ9026040.1 RcnB family protein [Acinetobacter gerneri]MDQ9053350.1 RcnB family protein [Acinetobacter gerneri]MDQ9060969.1 RcnB family protein [Acinetobacter gerneri]
MKKIISAIAFTVSTALAASSAMAAPNDHHYPQHQNSHQQVVKHNTPHANKDQWKVGHTYPSQYRGAGYKVDHKQYKKLSRPGHNQQWYKVNGQYVLVNTQNHHIIKTVR